MNKSVFLKALLPVWLAELVISSLLHALGAVSISVVSILAVGISFLITSAGLIAFSGFILATVMFSVIPQALFGTVGGLVARKVYAKAT